MTAAVSALFTAEQRALLKAAANQIIPAQAPLPGAGDLDAPAFIERFIAPRLQLRRLFLEGLAQLDIVAAQGQGKPFVELAPEEQLAALQAAEAANPRFFEELVRQTYNSYYTNPTVNESLGYRPGEPYQALPFDEKLLEPQRQRKPLWRSV